MLSNLSAEQEEAKRLKLLDDKGYSEDKLIAFRRNIARVSPEEAKALGETLLKLIDSKNYQRNENIAAATKLIFAGANLEVKDPKDGDTDLIVCSKKNLYTTFALLVKAGADINAQNKSLSTATMWSSRKGFKNILEDLLLLKADINLHCFDGDTALISAARHNQEESVRRLVQSNVILDAQNNLGQDALFIARDSNFTTIVNIIAQALIEEANRQPECTAEIVSRELESAREKLKSLKRPL